MTNTSNQTTQTASDKADEKLGGLRDAYHTGVDKASETLHSSADAAKRTVQGLESNPLGIVVGGLAVGILAGALLPRSQREKELLAPIGQRLSDSARGAVQAAREAGQGELENLGLTKDAARGQARGLIEGVVQAISTAGAAAAKGATQKVDV